MNVVTIQGLNDSPYPIQPGELPDDTYMTAQALKYQTVNLSGRSHIDRRDLKRVLRTGATVTPGMRRR